MIINIYDGMMYKFKYYFAPNSNKFYSSKWLETERHSNTWNTLFRKEAPFAFCEQKLMLHVTDYDSVYPKF